MTKIVFRSIGLANPKSLVEADGSFVQGASDDGSMGLLVDEFLDILEGRDSPGSDYGKRRGLLDLCEGLEVRALHHAVFIDVGIDDRGALLGPLGDLFDQDRGWGFGDIEPTFGCHHSILGVES